MNMFIFHISMRNDIDVILHPWIDNNIKTKIERERLIKKIYTI